MVADDVVIEAESWTAGAAPIAQDEGPELASATWGETPAELAAALAEFDAMQAPAEPPRTSPLPPSRTRSPSPPPNCSAAKALALGAAAAAATSGGDADGTAERRLRGTGGQRAAAERDRVARAGGRG